MDAHGRWWHAYTELSRPASTSDPANELPDRRKGWQCALCLWRTYVTLSDGRQVEIRCLREGLVFSPGLPEGCSELVNEAASDYSGSTGSGKGQPSSLATVLGGDVNDMCRILHGNKG